METYKTYGKSMRKKFFLIGIRGLSRWWFLPRFLICFNISFVMLFVATYHIFEKHLATKNGNQVSKNGKHATSCGPMAANHDKKFISNILFSCSKYEKKIFANSHSISCVMMNSSTIFDMMKDNFCRVFFIWRRGF